MNAINNVGTSKPCAMHGSGIYDENCLPQNRVTSHLAQLLDLHVASTLQNSEEKLFHLVDYGCSTGRNSIDLFRVAVRSVLENPRRSVCITRCDLPNNDFNHLAMSLSETREDNSRIFETMSPGSFNRQLLPENMVNLGVCSLALHWLEGVSMESTSVSVEGTHQEFILHAHWRKQLDNFLGLRARELKQGGALFIAHLNRSSVEDSKHGPFRLIDTAIDRLGLRKPMRCVLPIFRPTHRQLLDAVQESSTDLQIVSEHELIHRQPFFDASDPSYDKDLTASRYANFILAFAGPFLQSHFGDEISMDALAKAMTELVKNQTDMFEPKNNYSIVKLVLG